MNQYVRVVSKLWLVTIVSGQSELEVRSVQEYTRQNGKCGARVAQLIEREERGEYTLHPADS